ncbi:MAG: sigma-70 family RNA polymerase sigma factor [Rhizobiaceae bacterium]|nr:sigma-70 family RNA polymerase sigma factor [Rhizobiaceae bacterium]
MSMTAPRPGAQLSAEESRRLLVEVAAAQDRTAFAALFAFYAPRVKAFMLRFGMTAPVAEDLAQETMLLVWKKAAYFDPSKAGVSTWIFTIARNLRVDRLRRESRPLAAVDILDPSDEPEAPVSGEAVVLTIEREERVRRALALLPSDQATVVKLSFFGEKAQSEIASELGIPLGTVKSRVRLAFGRLREILDDLK